jgi:hypothetical protein
MEVVFGLPLLLIPFVLPIVAGLMAKSFGRKFWPWFFIGIPLPFIANIILLCLPDKTKKENEAKSEENERGSGHFVTKEDIGHRIDSEKHISARA